MLFWVRGFLGQSADIVLAENYPPGELCRFETDPASMHLISAIWIFGRMRCFR
jgi:hypothetical protein